MTNPTPVPRRDLFKFAGAFGAAAAFTATLSACGKQEPISTTSAADQLGERAPQRSRGRAPTAPSRLPSHTSWAPTATTP